MQKKQKVTKEKEEKEDSSSFTKREGHHQFMSMDYDWQLLKQSSKLFVKNQPIFFLSFIMTLLEAYLDSKRQHITSLFYFCLVLSFSYLVVVQYRYTHHCFPLLPIHYASTKQSSFSQFDSHVILFPPMGPPPLDW